MNVQPVSEIRVVQCTYFLTKMTLIWKFPFLYAVLNEYSDDDVDETFASRLRKWTVSLQYEISYVPSRYPCSPKLRGRLSIGQESAAFWNVSERNTTCNDNQCILKCFKQQFWCCLITSFRIKIIWTQFNQDINS